MTRTKAFIWLKASVILLFMGCRGSSDEVSLESDYFIRAKVNGELVEVKGDIASYVSTVAFNIQGTTLNLYRPKGFTLSIYPNDVQGTGSYTMQSGSDVIVVGQYFEGTDTYSTLAHPNGGITITKYDKEQKIVEGTFHFVGYKDGNGPEKKLISEGEFRCKGL
ncbi:DUF6252 family protein [Bergeyella zoohelcum]|uniref:Uncharacterized protein n=1 Tax=Bergeyella zoohelcum TaxID=1015 RepID=A0A380ZSN8_9FLAO|nr:DUF6252 family protein [Bergeyella zoohelcum]EKB61677.1 hypothetical protein HMPREF9700_00039 [Bergeyella zoohelcum CCUG 30536]SUV52377.1 Uncharacterised protein [Bergeyella zoohelcum]